MTLTDDPDCSPQDYLHEARRFAEAAQSIASPYTEWPLLQNWRPGQPLRVSLVSGDLRQHPVGYFIESVLAKLDPARIELFAYSIIPNEDALTARIKPHFSAWRNIWLLQVDDATAAATIHNDGSHSDRPEWSYPF